MQGEFEGSGAVLRALLYARPYSEFARIGTEPVLEAQGAAVWSLASAAQAVAYARAICERDPEATCVVSVSELSDSTNEREASDLVALSSFIRRNGVAVTLPIEDLTRTALGDDEWYEDAGTYRVGETLRSERIFFLRRVGDADTEPHQAPVTNLPRRLSSFVGRSDDVAKLQEMLFERAFVTVTGLPGVGKTSLATEAVRALVPDYTGGVWFFPFEQAGSFADVMTKIAKQVGFLELKGPVTRERLADAMAAKNALVILDGVDRHRDEVAALLNSIFLAGGSLSVLVTCGQRLNVPNEFLLPLEPFKTLAPPFPTNPENVWSDAVYLFIERARQVRPEFELNHRTIQDVLDLCYLTDGLPLAIEVVASRLGNASPKRLKAALGNPGKLKSRLGGTEKAELSEVFEVAISGLPAAELDVLSKLSLFSGSLIVEAFDRIWSMDASDIVQSLAEKSLVQVDPERDMFTLPNILGAHMRNRIAPDQKAQLLARFAAGIIAEYRGNADAFVRGDQDVSDALARRYGDVLLLLTERSAVLDDAQIETLLEIMPGYWIRRELYEDMGIAVAILLQTGRLSDRARARAELLGGIARTRGRSFELAELMLRRSFESYIALDDRPGEAMALGNLAMCYSQQGSTARAYRTYKRSLRLSDPVSDPRRFATTLANSAHALLKDIQRRENLSNPRRQALLARATAILQRAKNYQISDRLLDQAITTNEGIVLMESGHFGSAKVKLGEALEICIQNNLESEACEATKYSAQIALVERQFVAAAKLYGAWLGLQLRTGRIRTEHEANELHEAMGKLNDAIGQIETGKLIDYGSKLDLVELAGIRA